LCITKYLGHSEKDFEKNGSFQGDLTKADPLKKRSLTRHPALAFQLYLIMIHQSQKVRKTTAEAKLPGIYTPGNKTQTWFRKKLLDPCIRNGGSYMVRG